MSTLAFDCEHMQVFHRAGSSRYLLCTFNELGFRADGINYWAKRLADRLDLNCLGFVTKRPNWFPESALAEAIAAVRHLAEHFEVRYGYGHSQGGYAAIKASRPLDFAATIAFCPQFSIDPIDVEDPRFNPYFDPAHNSGMAVRAEDAPNNLFMFYDPADVLDRTHVECIAHAVPARRVPVPFTGHRTVQVVAGEHKFKKLIQAIEGGIPLGKMVHAARRKHAVRYAELSLRAASRHPMWALALMDSGNVVAENLPGICYRLSEAGASTRALPWALRAADELPSDAEAQAVCALLLAQTGSHLRAQSRIVRAKQLSTDPKFEWIGSRIAKLRSVKRASLKIDVQKDPS